MEKWQNFVYGLACDGDQLTFSGKDARQALRTIFAMHNFDVL